MVFGAGFLLGPIRVFYLAPRIGERWAELAEMPVMLTVIVLAARWVVGRFGLTKNSAWFTGLAAFAMLTAVEFGLVLALRGLTLRDYLETRDPVSGSVYGLALVLFAAMPRLCRPKTEA